MASENEVHIQLNEQYQLGSDSKSWYLAKKRKHLDSVRWEPFKWFNNLENAVLAYYDHRLRTCGATNEKELLTAVAEVRQEIKEAFRKTFELSGVLVWTN